MAAEAKQIVIENIWNGLYGESWKGLICDEAFAHPAKFSRALIRRIYDHVIEEGWATKGSSVVDPFGGVALGAFDAMRHGLNWYGCELESRFVGLGGQNITLWNERFSRMPNWGTARLLQGDSRKLVEVLSAAECCVSSPPYIEPCGHGGQPTAIDLKKRTGGDQMLYGQSEGQLGAMKEGVHSLVVSSPPYVGSLANAKNYADPEKAKADSEREFMKHRSATYSDLRYGDTEGNLGAMPEGQLAITSPPFESSTQVNNTPGDMTQGRARWEGGTDSAARVKQDYADYSSEANLGNMRGGFEAAISSPPYEATRLANQDQWAGVPRGECHSIPEKLNGYGPTTVNRTTEDRETFWSASRLILQQLHQVIVPGGHAVFVVKAFVRDKQIVDFPAQWAQLCEVVGFRLLHHHRASLVEHSGTQGGFEEDKEIRVERKSFFRRLAEKKGSPRIDHESVLCFERLA